jgi:hypothetical protein
MTDNRDSAIQLGFDGSVRLLTGDSQALDAVINLTRQTYEDYARAIEPEAGDRAVYWRIIFALLSVHSPFHATVDDYRALRLWSVRYSRLPIHHQSVRHALERVHAVDGVLQYIPTKSYYVADFTRAWLADSSPFTRNGDTFIDWRKRLQTNVKGLGLAKASFAVALCNPVDADICCVDSHIHALFTDQPARNAIKPSVYLAIEDTIRRKAHEHHIGTFVLQWLLWDAKRGVRESHACLADRRIA